MYKMLRTALAAVLLLAGPVAADTVLHMTSEPGDYIGQGNEYTVSAEIHTFNANRNYDNGVSFYLTAAGADFWHVDFAAPDEVELTAGTYADATRWPFQALPPPLIAITTPAVLFVVLRPVTEASIFPLVPPQVACTPMPPPVLGKPPSLTVLMPLELFTINRKFPPVSEFTERWSPAQALLCVFHVVPETVRMSGVPPKLVAVLLFTRN
jgi:hypothetical protein